MKASRFFGVLALLLLLAVCIDIAVGKVGSYLVQSSRGGNIGRHEYINRFADEELLIFGSSRAIHHYDPRILRDSLGLSSYNCGTDGCGVLLSYMQFSNIALRHKPKIIVYDMYGPYDFLQEPDLSKYLGWERVYYGHLSAEADSVFYDVNPAEKWKMLSQSYRYNSKILNLLSDYFAPRQGDIMGYRPEKQVISDEAEPPAPWPTTGLDGLKMKYLTKLAQRCSRMGIKLYICVSPYYFESNDEQLPGAVRSILDEYGAVVLDHSADRDFIGKREYFSDTNHLNEAGATLYTSKIASEIRAYE